MLSFFIVMRQKYLYTVYNLSDKVKVKQFSCCQQIELSGFEANELSAFCLEGDECGGLYAAISLLYFNCPFES